MPATRRPLRLLLLTDTAILGPGGSERFLRNLVANLGERYSVDVLQLAAQPDEPQRVGRLEHAGVRVLYRPVEAIYAPRGIAAYASVARMVLGGGYDILQSQHEKSDMINACLPPIGRLRRISNRRDMGFQKSRRVRALFRRANRRFDRIVAPSREILRALVAEENADAGRCVAIPNGVDTQRFQPADAARRAQLRAQLDCGADDWLIGCVASFSPVKQHATLVAAFALLHERHPQARLLLVGTGPLRADIEAQVSALGLDSAVRLLGARSDIEQILPALDVFVLASSTEGMSNAILEAQACALGVVATAVGGNPELVTHGSNGLLVAAADAAGLARALDDLASAPQRCRALGAAGRRGVEQRHSVAAMTMAYQDLYEELADAR